MKKIIKFMMLVLTATLLFPASAQAGKQVVSNTDKSNRSFHSIENRRWTDASCDNTKSPIESGVSRGYFCNVYLQSS